LHGKKPNHLDSISSLMPLSQAEPAQAGPSDGDFKSSRDLYGNGTLKRQ
jgi:hypothetical protein